MSSNIIGPSAYYLVYKWRTTVIVNRIRETLDFHQPRGHAGFSNGFSTMDHVNAINQVIEKCAECNRPLYLTFIQYENAFDSVQIAAVMKALRGKGVEGASMRLLQNIYQDSNGAIILHKQSEKFSIRKGVRQRDIISPKLFIASLESVFRKLDREKLGVRVNGENLSHLRFVDDIVLLISSVEDLQGMIHDLNGEGLVVGLKIKMKKSKVMTNSLTKNSLPVKQPFTIGNEILGEEYEQLFRLISQRRSKP